MLKRITEPQAMYQKDHNGDEPGMSSVTPTSNKVKNKRKTKMIAGTLGALLFLVVGVAGIMVSQRQQQVAGPVAPNAPASIPKASEDACAISFTVDAPPVVPPPEEPPPEETYGSAVCTTKIAYLVESDDKLTPLSPNEAVLPGSIIQYEIPVDADNQTRGTVVLEDTLDANVTYEPAANQPTTDGTVVANGRKLTITLPAFTAGSQKKHIKYRVKVATRTQPFSFTNTVVMTDNGNDVPGTANSCTTTLKTAATGIASCKDKTAYTLDSSGKKTSIANNASVLPGSEYYYSIMVEAAGQTSGPVVIKDTLPAGITLSDDKSKNTAGITSEVVAGKTVVTYTIPAGFGSQATEDAKEEKEIIFKVTLAGTVNPGVFKNLVAVTTGTSTTPSTCDHTVEVKADGIASCVAKEMHSSAISAGGSESQTHLTENRNFNIGDEFFYRVKVKSDANLAIQTTGVVTVTDTLPSALEVVDAGDFTVTNGKYVVTYPAFKGEKTAQMKVKVKAGATGPYTNSVVVTTAGSTNSNSTCESEFNVPIYSCNASCETAAQCQQYNSNHTCTTTSEGKFCRLASNTSSLSCDGVTTTPTPTPTPPTTVVQTPTPTPVVGCNVRCSTNADCSNNAHICYQTADGGRCRLDSNVTSESCSNPVAVVQSTPTPAPGQPQLPEELPQTGPEDWANWLKAGLVTLGIGAVLLLLL